MRRQSVSEQTGSGSLPSWVEPQLATLTKDRFSDPAWIFERKLDVERCLAFGDRSQGLRLLTRNQHDVTGADAITALRCREASSQREAVCGAPHNQTGAA